MTATLPASPELTDELLPCPFCGGRAEYEQTEGALHEARWTIGCLENNDRNNLCMAYQSLTTFATKREARLAWNTRHRSSPSSAWGDIKDAPKDGTEFQAWVGHWEPRCRYNDDGAFQIWGRVDYDQDGWDIYSNLTPTRFMPQPESPR